MTRFPAPALLLGAGGLIPFVAGSALVVTRPDMAATALQALSAYGAVILSFLGGPHWGVVLAGAERPGWYRLGWGVIPSLIAWPTLLMPTTVALPVLMLGIVLTWAVDLVAVRQGLFPRWWRPLRGGLTLVVVVALAAAWGASLAM